MVKKIISLVAILVVIIGVYFVFIKKSEDDVVKEIIISLCHNASKDENEKLPVTALKNQNLQRIFDEKCLLSFGINQFNGLYNNLTLVNMITNVNHMVKSSKLTASDMKVTFLFEDEASVNFTGKFFAISNSGEEFSDIKLLVAHLSKVENKWKITSIKLLEVLEK